MNVRLDLLLAALPTCLLCFVACPAMLANRYPRLLRRVVTGWVGCQALLAIALACGLAVGVVPPIDTHWWGKSANAWLSLGLHYDDVAAVMLALVSSVGWFVCRYSQRYLDGEPRQGSFFGWLAVTLGAVSWMIICGDLLLFWFAWIATSFGLHQLLLHYPHRPAAQAAAWSKFIVSRIGDVAIMLAMFMIYAEFRTLEFQQLFAAVSAPDFVVTLSHHAACVLLLLGAASKSAQFPMHSWLPQTLETPTPVSALMHAGIVNAGGYLVIRLSPLLVLSPWSLSGLAVVGGITACYGATVMLTQTSVKKTLAYSTIAQMGFMMLQCGLGAFSAAMLHIIAHSLYKAYAFLNSGSVLAEVSGSQVAAQVAGAGRLRYLWLAAPLNIALLLAALALFGIDPRLKPGGGLLGFVLCLAFTHWLSHVLATGQARLIVRGIVVSGLMCLSYAASFWAVDAYLSSSLPKMSGSISTGLAATLVVLGFLAMFALQRLRAAPTPPVWLAAWQIHASNGFYVEAWLRRRLANS